MLFFSHERSVVVLKVSISSQNRSHFHSALFQSWTNRQREKDSETYVRTSQDHHNCRSITVLLETHCIYWWFWWHQSPRKPYACTNKLYCVGVMVKHGTECWIKIVKLILTLLTVCLHLFAHRWSSSALISKHSGLGLSGVVHDAA